MEIRIGNNIIVIPEQDCDKLTIVIKDFLIDNKIDYMIK